MHWLILESHTRDNGENVIKIIAHKSPWKGRGGKEHWQCCPYCKLDFILHADLCCVGVRAWKYWLIKALFSLNHCIPCFTSVKGDTHTRMRQILLNFGFWQTSYDIFFFWYCRLVDSQQIYSARNLIKIHFQLTRACPETLTLTHMCSVCNYCSLVVFPCLHHRVDSCRLPYCGSCIYNLSMIWDIAIPSGAVTS